MYFNLSFAIPDDSLFDFEKVEGVARVLRATADEMTRFTDTGFKPGDGATVRDDNDKANGHWGVTGS